VNKDKFHKLADDYINKSCIYQEGRIVCCAQVNDIQLFDTEMQASLMMIPTPGFLPYSLTDWTVSCVWQHFSFNAERWSAICIGLIWKVYFNPDFMTEISELAIAISTEQNDKQRRFMLGQNINKLDWEMLRARRADRETEIYP
jgi:hypothetical protein